MFLANSANRVRKHTAKSDLLRIERKTRNDLAYFAGHPEEIDARLNELHKEWDVERVLEFNSSVISLAGIILGAFRNRKWLFLPAAVQMFFLQHGVQGWCPPLPLIRKLGVRTQREIETEREALEALRGNRDLDPAMHHDNVCI